MVCGLQHVFSLLTIISTTPHWEPTTVSFVDEPDVLQTPCRHLLAQNTPSPTCTAHVKVAIMLSCCGVLFIGLRSFYIEYEKGI